jgi:hypothetical protein
MCKNSTSLCVRIQRKKPKQEQNLKWIPTDAKTCLQTFQFLEGKDDGEPDELGKPAESTRGET